MILGFDSIKIQPLLEVDRPARLLIRFVFGFASDSDFAFVKLNQNINKEWDGNAV